MNENKLGDILLTIGSLIIVGVIVYIVWLNTGFIGGILTIAMFCILLGIALFDKFE